jgi:hypothetical protein
MNIIYSYFSSFVSDLGGAPNWISINQVLLKIRAVQSAMEVIPSSKNKWVHPKEAFYIASKLKAVSSKIFNSTECRSLAEVSKCLQELISFPNVVTLVVRRVS